MDMPYVERKQATVMSADVVGYAQMMADNDLQTMRTLLDCRERIAGLTRGHGGRVVDAVGDNLLAEFSTASAAWQCANHVQEMLRERNLSCAPSERMVFRIGLHCGSLLATGEGLFGDVVNLAARLQHAAPPGRIMLSGAVVAGLGAWTDPTLIERGERRFKNIPYAISTFEAAPSWG